MVSKNRALNQQFVTAKSRQPGVVWDRYMGGFGLRIGSRRRSFFVQTWCRGKLIKYSIGHVDMANGKDTSAISAEDARKKAGEILLAAKAGVDLREQEKDQRRVNQKAKQRTFAVLCQQFMREEV